MDDIEFLKKEIGDVQEDIKHIKQRSDNFCEFKASANVLIQKLSEFTDDIHNSHKEFVSSVDQKTKNIQKEAYRIEVESKERDKDLELKQTKIMTIGAVIIFILSVFGRPLLNVLF